MQDKERKSLVSRLEIAFLVVFLTVASIALYLFGLKWVFSLANNSLSSVGCYCFVSGCDMDNRNEKMVAT